MNSIRTIILLVGICLSSPYLSQKDDSAIQCSEQKKMNADIYTKEADSLLVLNEYERAKNLYLDALFECPSEHIVKMLNYTESAIYSLQGKNYNKLVDSALDHYNSGELDKALLLFKAALALKPEDSYVSKKIQEIETK